MEPSRTSAELEAAAMVAASASSPGISSSSYVAAVNAMVEVAFGRGRSGGGWGEAGV